MKKIRWLILFIVITAAATFIAVSGFYIDENKSAVVNWLNNKYVVTNDDYKNLIAETTATISQLNDQIDDLEEKNVNLTNEKTSLLSDVELLESELDLNEELIQSYLKQIEELNCQIEENERLILELRSLVSSLSQKVITEIVKLPENLNNVYLSFAWCGNNAFVYSDTSLYYFNYSQGSLTEVSSSKICQTGQLFKIIQAFNDGYLFTVSDNQTYSYRVSTNELIHHFSMGLESSDAKCVEYGNGCYMFYRLNCKYFNYSTFEFETIYHGVGGSEIYLYDGYVVSYYTYTASSGSTSTFIRTFTYFDLETRDYKVLDVANVASTGSTYKYFYFKDVHYFLTHKSTESLYYLVKLDFVNGEYSVIWSDESKTLNWTIYLHLFENDFVVFNNYTIPCLFDGETVITGDAVDRVRTSNSKDSKILLEYENKVYFAKDSDYTIYCYDRENKQLSVVINSNSSYYKFYVLSDTVFSYINSSYRYAYDIVSDTSTVLGSSSLSLLWDIGDSYYFTSNENSTSGYIYRVYKETMESKLIIKDIPYFKSCYVLEDKIVFYGLNKYFVYSVSSTGANMTSHSYVGELSDITSGLIYVKISDLEEGTLCYKYQYDENYEDYIRSLVVVK